MVLLLGLDVGTQSTKALLYDESKKEVVARASREYDLLQTDVPGRAEQHPETWISACEEVMTAVLSQTDQLGALRAIGVSGQQHGLVALDEKGEVLRPAKLWCDVESSEEAKELSSKLGYVMVPSVTLTKILWLKKNEAANYERMRTVLLPHDYVNYRLTGRLCMESGDASGTGAFDIYKRSIDEGVLELVDASLVEKFPEVIGPNERVGIITATWADFLGVPEDVIVSPGSGDNMMSALGAGAVSDGVLVLSIGTSGTLFGCSSKPIFDVTGVVCPFCDATGQWLPLACTISCTKVIQEVKTCFGLSHEDLIDLAEQEPIGCNGVNFLPYLSGERTPNWPNATGALLGLSPGSLRPGLLYRAALEGVTFTLLNALKGMKALGMTAAELRVVGGGSKNRLWKRIIADSFQMPLRFPIEPESAALGAALQAGAVFNGVPIADYVQSQQVPLSDETVLPNKETAEAYAKAFERHIELGTTLFANTSQ